MVCEMEIYLSLNKNYSNHPLEVCYLFGCVHKKWGKMNNKYINSLRKQQGILIQQYFGDTLKKTTFPNEFFVCSGFNKRNKRMKFSFPALQLFFFLYTKRNTNLFCGEVSRPVMIYCTTIVNCTNNVSTPHQSNKEIFMSVAMYFPHNVPLFYSE